MIKNDKPRSLLVSLFGSMVLGVKYLSTSNFKGRCRGCNRTLRNNQLCVFDRTVPAKRYYHIGCRWGKSIVWKVERGALFAFDEVPANERTHVQGRIDAAVRRVKLSASHLRQERVQQQLEEKRQWLQEYPVGQKLVYKYESGMIDFVQIVSYSRLGKSVRAQVCGRHVLDKWNDGWQDYFGHPVRRTVILYEADWTRSFNTYINVHTTQFGLSLLRGSDYARPVEYDPTVQEVEPAISEGPVVNAMNPAGKLMYSTAMSKTLTVTRLRDEIAMAVGLRPARGSIMLCLGSRILKGPELVINCLIGDGPLELTAVVQDNKAWPVADDGRHLPYALEYTVCSESLAFEIRTGR